VQVGLAVSQVGPGGFPEALAAAALTLPTGFTLPFYLTGSFVYIEPVVEDIPRFVVRLVTIVAFVACFVPQPSVHQSCS
jgi:hypothetical protein